MVPPRRCFTKERLCGRQVRCRWFNRAILPPPSPSVLSFLLLVRVPLHPHSPTALPTPLPSLPPTLGPTSPPTTSAPPSASPSARPLAPPPSNPAGGGAGGGDLGEAGSGGSGGARGVGVGAMAGAGAGGLLFLLAAVAAARACFQSPKGKRTGDLEGGGGGGGGFSGEVELPIAGPNQRPDAGKPLAAAAGAPEATLDGGATLDAASGGGGRLATRSAAPRELVVPGGDREGGDRLGRASPRLSLDAVCSSPQPSATDSLCVRVCVCLPICPPAKVKPSLLWLFPFVSRAAVVPVLGPCAFCGGAKVGDEAGGADPLAPPNRASFSVDTPPTRQSLVRLTPSEPPPPLISILVEQRKAAAAEAEAERQRKRFLPTVPQPAHHAPYYPLLLPETAQRTFEARAVLQFPRHFICDNPFGSRQALLANLPPPMTPCALVLFFLDLIVGSHLSDLVSGGLLRRVHGPALRGPRLRGPPLGATGV
jgi:hypothetical protein